MKHRVVVLGAGYAGLPAAQRIARQVRSDEVEVTLLNATADFIERPRLHQLATGQPIPERPLAAYLKGTAVELLIGTVTGIDLVGRRILVAERSFDGRVARRPSPGIVGYDTLVYALGSNIDVGSVPGVAEHAYSLTSRAAAKALHARLAELSRSGPASVIVCGGGLTGIETAAEIAEFYPDLRVGLMTAGVPGGWLSGKAQGYLRRVFDELGVQVRVGSRVREMCSDRLLVEDGAAVPFDVCVWAGGFRVAPLAATSGLAVNQEGRALVDPTLQSLSHPGVYVVGDAAAAAGPWGEELAMGCRTGGFMGPRVADAVVARLTGTEPKPFKYRYIHECISLGRQHAVVQFLSADESPKDRILTGWAALRYKNATLRGAQLMFRHPGPYRPHRRHALAAPRVKLVAA